MIRETITDVKVTLVNEDGNYINSNILHTATDQNIWDFAKAVEGLQIGKAEKIVKTVKSELMFVL